MNPFKKQNTNPNFNAYDKKQFYVVLKLITL